MANPVEYYCQAMSARRAYFCCLAMHLHAGRQHETPDGIRFNVPVSRPKQVKDIKTSGLSFRFDGRR